MKITDRSTFLPPHASLSVSRFQRRRRVAAPPAAPSRPFRRASCPPAAFLASRGTSTTLWSHLPSCCPPPLLDTTRTMRVPPPSRRPRVASACGAPNLPSLSRRSTRGTLSSHSAPQTTSSLFLPTHSPEPPPPSASSPAKPRRGDTTSRLLYPKPNPLIKHSSSHEALKPV